MEGIFFMDSIDNNVFISLRKIICDQLDIDEERVTLESNILEDFDADSLDIVDIAMSIEDEFGIEVPDDEIENFHTVGDVAQYIEDNT
jgi:acyl carrier protein